MWLSQGQKQSITIKNKKIKQYNHGTRIKQGLFIEIELKIY